MLIYSFVLLPFSLFHLSLSLILVFVPVFILSTDLCRSHTSWKRPGTNLSQFLRICLPTIARNELLQYTFIGLMLDIFSWRTEPLASSLMIKNACLKPNFKDTLILSHSSLPSLSFALPGWRCKRNRMRFMSIDSLFKVGWRCLNVCLFY